MRVGTVVFKMDRRLAVRLLGVAASVVSRPSALRNRGAQVSRFHQSAQRLGMMDNIKSWMGSKTEEAKEKAKEKLFQQQMDFMTTNPTYTMSDHVKLYESMAEKAGVTGWRKMLLTEAQKAELAEQLVDLKIGTELTDVERANVESLDGKSKVRIAAAVGCEVERVNRFVDSYLQSVKIHGWLQGRKAKGVAIPTNMTEFVHCMMADRQHFQAPKKGQGGGAGAKRTKGAIRNTMRRM